MVEHNDCLPTALEMIFVVKNNYLLFKILIYCVLDSKKNVI